MGVLSAKMYPIVTSEQAVRCDNRVSLVYGEFGSKPNVRIGVKGFALRQTPAKNEKAPARAEAPCLIEVRKLSRPVLPA